MQKIRRCREDREDFTSADGAVFPIQIHKGAGESYGFCPAKATWDPEVKAQFEELVLIAETKWMPVAGGLYDQPAWLMDLLSWFLPKYEIMKFLRKADMILGGSGGKMGANSTAAGKPSARGR